MRLTPLLLLLLLVVYEIPASAASSINVNGVTASPGKYDLTLGAGFPGLGPVKLSYPNSSILTNSVGDLLFAVTLNPLMLNYTSGQLGSIVQVYGSGFSSSDTVCRLSGSPVSLSSCTISGGVLTGHFTVDHALAGAHLITAAASPANDFSSATFTVLPPSLVLNPSSGPDSVLQYVSVSGFGFYSTDTTCALTGSPVSTPAPCTIGGGILNDTFAVAGPVGTYTISATTNGADSGEATTSFTVTASQYIQLSASFGHVGDPVALTTGSGFSLSPADTSCTLSGRIVTSPTPCVITGGTITTLPSFTVSNVAPGIYTVTVIGSPKGDLATADFQVFPAAADPPISTPVSLDIYIPPDFTGLTTSKTWTSFTNNYDPHILTLSRLSASDQIGPNWWKVSISGITVTNRPSSYPSPLVAHQVFLVNQTQYIRLFQVASPSIAGRYFFKAFINGLSIGSDNFPTLVVKGSRDPAFISGVLRDSGAHNASMEGKPIQLLNGTGARVLATGRDYLGNAVSAQTFINSTALGTYTLFGVAPGTYNITAYAAGYIPATDSVKVSVGPAQSLEAVDIYLTSSVTITGTVLSKNAEGSPIPWGEVFGVSLGGASRRQPRAITVSLLNLDGSVAASTAAPYGLRKTADPTSTFFPFTIQQQVGFDGRIPQDYANYTSGLTSGDYLLYAYVTSYVQLDEVRVHVNNETTQTTSMIPLIRTGTFEVTVHFRNQNGTIGPDSIPVDATLTVSAYDPRGILRAQNVTFVKKWSTEATVELQGFSNARSFGVASLFSQNYGLLPGTYQIVARVSSAPTVAGNANLGIKQFYYQTTNVEATIGLGDGVVSLSFLVYKAGGLNLTIYSIDDQTPSVTIPWHYANSTMNGISGATINIIIIGSNGAVYQANATQIRLPSEKERGKGGNVTFTYVGLQTDSYEVVVQTLGYTQREILHLNVVLGGTGDGSVWMIENPVINMTVFFRDEGLLSAINSTLPFAQPINNISGTPVRIEVFDDRGNFVAANVSYIPNSLNGLRYANFTLAGFDRYYGDPRFIWSGFYDTTDGASQSPGGLFLYPWDNLPREFTVRIWVEGYYQMDQLQVLVPPRGGASVVEPLDRATRIAGNVIGPDFFGFARPLSWATITLQPNNYTVTSIIDVRPGNYTTYSLDGSFQLWVPEGSYGMGVSLAGYSTYTALVGVPSGSDMNMQIWLDNYQASLLTNPLLATRDSSMIQAAGTGMSQDDRPCFAT